MEQSNFLIDNPDFEEWSEKPMSKRRQSTIWIFTFAFDPKFWVIIPGINLNFHSKTLEFEWMCFAMYIDIEYNDTN